MPYKINMPISWVCVWRVIASFCRSPLIPYLSISSRSICRKWDSNKGAKFLISFSYGVSFFWLFVLVLSSIKVSHYYDSSGKTFCCPYAILCLWFLNDPFFRRTVEDGEMDDISYFVKLSILYCLSWSSCFYLSMIDYVS